MKWIHSNIWPVEIKHYFTLEEQWGYTLDLYVKANEQYLNVVFFPDSFGMKRTARQIIASLEWTWRHFQKELNEDLSEKERVLNGLEHAYIEFDIDYNKALYYSELYEELYNDHKDIYTPVEQKSIQLGIDLQKALIYKLLKQYGKSIEIYKQIPEKNVYQIRKNVDTKNLWPEVYNYIADIYAYKLHDWENAKAYYKKMAVDLTKLPAERIGSLDITGIVTSADLQNLTEQNRDNSFNQLYYAARDLHKYKEVQQIFVNKLIIIENNIGYIVCGDGNYFFDLIKERKRHGKLVKFQPSFVRIESNQTPPQYTVVPFSVYLEEQYQLFKKGKPSNWQWLEKRSFWQTIKALF